MIKKSNSKNKVTSSTVKSIRRDERKRPVFSSKNKKEINYKKEHINKNYYAQRKGDNLNLYSYSTGQIKTRKKYNKQTYNQDIENAKYNNNFKNYKVNTNYGKRVTWRSSKYTQKYYNISEKESKPKYLSQDTINKKDKYVIIVYGTVTNQGHTRKIDASSKAHEIGYNIQNAKAEAKENFYRLAYGEINGTGSDEPPADIDIEKKSNIEGYYISYKDKGTS